MKKLYWIGFLILIFQSAFAQSSMEGTVKGTVKNINNEAQEYLMIWTEPASSEVFTNEKGEFSLNLKPGKYELFVGEYGSSLQSNSIYVIADKTVISD